MTGNPSNLRAFVLLRSVGSRGSGRGAGAERLLENLTVRPNSHGHGKGIRAVGLLIEPDADDPQTACR